MAQSILVAYATTYGSTQETAQFITKTLRDGGFTTDLQPARQVKNLAPYQAVILGAPLYMFRWHGDARHFLGKHRAALAGLPTAIFALGPFHNIEDELKSAREQLDKELVKFTWLKPASVKVFAGKFDPAALRFPYSLIGPLKKMPASDERNWEAIRAWAGEFASTLKIKEQ